MNSFIDLDNSARYCPSMGRGRPTSSSRLWVEYCDYVRIPKSDPRPALPQRLLVKGLFDHSIDINISSADGKRVTIRVGVTATYPHFGGVRYWYVCPHCDRRTAKLFAPEGILACRVCLRLVYRVQYRKGLSRYSSFWS